VHSLQALYALSATRECSFVEGMPTHCICVNTTHEVLALSLKRGNCWLVNDIMVWM
jgi:hypothetical protein